MQTRKMQKVTKCVAALLAFALIFELFAFGASLTREEPGLPAGDAYAIVPESNKAVSDQEGEEGDNEVEEREDQEEEQPDDPRPGQKPEEEEPETEPEEEPITPPEEEEPEEEEPSDYPEPDDSAGGNGDTEDNGAGEMVPSEGPEDDSELRIVTDLRNGEITFDQLQNDILPFYAYLINGDGLTLRVKVRNSSTPQNGTYLTANGDDYQTTLVRNETNFFTLYVKDGNTTVKEVTYALRYVAQKADANHPTVGDNPPTIVTNLEGVDNLSNRNFTLTVQATAYTGKPLYSSNIEVTLDGKRVTNPTGGFVYEYQLYFENPEVGDVVHHTVTVRAWDNEGNSSFVSYGFDYHFVDTGGEIGTAYIILDATAVGLGILEEPYTYRIKQGVPASYAVLEMLEEYGYEFDYGGTPDGNFYLRRIFRGGLMDYPDIPENLWAKVLKDGLTLTGQSFSDSLGEFDFTQGSGWMYSVGGAVYAGKGLSSYYLNNGETLYLRFTLAYGKDIGGYVSTGGSFGTLATYCGKWINGTYIDMHQWSDPQMTKEPTCTEAGEKSCVCSVCGDAKDAVPVAALGHNHAVVERVEPADGADGYVVYRCESCGQEEREAIPWREEPVTPPEQSEDPVDPPAESEEL